MSLDYKHQRLFFGEEFGNRILVFDISDLREAQNPDAIAVIGQPDFESTDLALSQTRLTMPRITIDSERQLAYIPDGYPAGNRINIMDISPERMKTTLNSVLDQTEALNTRMNVFTFPREQYKVDLPGRSRLKYGSLDSRTSLGPEDLTVGYSEVLLNSPAPVLGTSTHLVTTTVIEGQSERESRLLISEAQLPVLKPGKRTQVFFDSRQNGRVSLSVVNPNSLEVSVEFGLSLQTGEQLGTTRRLGVGEQLNVEVTQLFGGIQQQSTGSLWIESPVPVQVGALLHVPNGHGVLTVPAPLAHPDQERAGQSVIPKVVTGAGYRTAFVLLNPSSGTMTGTLQVEGRQIGYTIQPGGLLVHEEDEFAGPAKTSYAVIRATDGGVPVGTGWISLRRRDGTLQTVRTVGSGQRGTLFWAPVDTYPTLLRHGEIKLRLSVVNEGPVPATVYLELFDIDGNSQIKYERIVPLGKRMEMGLEDVFGASRLRGTVRVFSDSEVSLSLEKRVVNIDDELILSEVPLQRTPETTVQSLIFPVFSNGSGVATELQLINTSRTATVGRLGVKHPQGTAVKTILR